MDKLCPRKSVAMAKNYFEIREACPACESTSTKEIYRAKFNEPPISDYLNHFYNPQGGVEFEYLEGESYILNECANCGLVYQKAIANDFLMEKLYEEWIDPKIVLENKTKNRNLNDYLALAREIETIIRHFDVPLNDLTFFDFGSGWGEWCNLAKGYGCLAFGSELSQTRIDHSRKLGVPIIPYEDIPEHRFDYINTEQVFEHIPKPLETLHYLTQSLKPNGIIKISVPNGGDIKRLLSVMDWSAPKGSENSLNPVAPLEHINCFSQRSILKMTEKLGLTPVQLSSTKNLKQIDYSLRDVLSPIHDKIKHRKYGSTYLFFQKTATTA